jgi:HEAT repeat protein
VSITGTLLDDLPAAGRNQVLRTLARCGDVGTFLDLLGDLSLDSHEDIPRMRALAIAMARIKSPEKLEEVQTVFDLALRSSNALVREEAARTLGLRPEAGAVESLRGLLKDPDLHVRFQAACSLMRREDHAGIPVLMEALETSGALADRASESLWLLRRKAERLDAWQWREWLEESGFLEKAEDVQ